MDRSLIHQDPASRWRQAAAVQVRERTPVHDDRAANHARQESRGQRGAAAAIPAIVTVPPVIVASSRYVLIPVAAAMTGLSRKAIERKIERKIWVEGKHFRRRDGGIYIDMDAYNRWVEDGK
jgi:hypothetical protein